MHQPSSDQEPLAYRIQDAVRVSGIGRTKLYELIGSGKLLTVRVGRCRLILAKSLQALLEAGDA
jgi:excisionase family DNA binding protein